MKTIEFKVEKTAHVYLVGTPSKQIKRLLIACHGYGYSARRWSSLFSCLDDGETLVLVPEGLSMFYFPKDGNPFTGNVGASWMTKENRETEISDYCNYLEKVYAHFVPQLADDVRITLLGFSQGGPTAIRFGLLKRPKFDNLVLWATDFASDLDYDTHRDFLNEKNVQWVVMNQDPFLNEKRRASYKEFVDNQKVNYTLFEFDGEHHVYPDKLIEIAKKWL